MLIKRYYDSVLLIGGLAEAIQLGMKGVKGSCQKMKNRYDTIQIVMHEKVIKRLIVLPLIR